MNDKFRNKYRIPSNRMQSWDYGWNGSYFITICTKNRRHYFGEMADGKMHFSEAGELANQYWLEIPLHFPYAKLGAFIIMPDHLHGILIIDKNSNLKVETRLIASPQSSMPLKTGGITGKKNPMLHDNISRIIRWYKGRCSFEIKKLKSDFEWQTRFHDHIIRNFIEYHRISHYIKNNPMNWKKDKIEKS
jgi:putative transposase